MKPKPPPNTPNPPTKTTKPQRPVKIPVRKQNGETLKSKRDKLKDDLSVLMKNISTNVTNLQEIIKLFKNATPEVIDLITNECSIILECKICKNLFRSLANFMTHKRGFCLGKFEQLFQNHEHGDHVWYSKCRKKNLLASRSTSRKDVLALIESLKRSVELEIPAATVLKDLEVSNEGLINLRYFSQDPTRDKSVTIAAEETPEDFEGELLSIDSSRCTFCNREFSSLKSLNSHLKKDHGDLRMCFVCPCCKKYFANAWSVYRHMYKVHRKTSEQVRKLRNQIQKKQVTQEELERSKRGHLSSPIEERDQEKAFMEDLKGHGSLQHCSECGKKFDRKVALMSHSAHCNKKLNPSTDLLRSLKRKALTPLKVDQEKKAKYTTEEMLVRLKALDARVVLTKTELPPFISLKKEKVDDYVEEDDSPKCEEEINLLVQAYQGKEDTIPPPNANEFEDLLNKIHMEVNHIESVCITDSDREENDKDSAKDKNLEPIEICSTSEGDESSHAEIESQDGFESQEEEETENDELESQKDDEAVSQMEDDDVDSCDRRNLVFVSAGEESDVDDIDEKDPLELDGEKNQDQSSLKDENERELSNRLEDVDEDQIETQEVSSVDSSLILDGIIIKQSQNESSSELTSKNEQCFFNRNNTNVQNETSQIQEDLVETEDNSFNVHTPVQEEVVTLDAEKSNASSYEIGRIRSPSEMDDSESNDFMGFSDLEENTNNLSIVQISIENNRNKVILKEFEIISTQSLSKTTSNDNTNDETSFLPDDSFNDLSKDGPSHEIMDDPLTDRYVCGDLEDNNYIVAKEIVLFSDSDGVCISNMSGSVDYELEALKSSLSSIENEEAGTCNRYFSKINGGSPSRMSTSPQNIDLEDDVADGSDWVTKKINSLINGQKKKCLLCFKTFHKVVFARRHVASHYNINKFKCLVNSCNFQSFLRADMNIHISKIHKKKELEMYAGRIYPKKEDFDDSSYIADPKIIYSFNKSYKDLNSSFDKIDLDDISEKDNKSLNSMILDEESLDGLNICEEMELPCKEDDSPKLLQYGNLSDEDDDGGGGDGDGGLSSLQDQEEPGQIMMDILGNKLGDSSQDSTLATS